MVIIIPSSTLTLTLLLLISTATSADPTTTATCTATCTAIHRHTSATSKCHYINSTPSCNPKGYINYLKFFYCTFSSSLPQYLAFITLLLWLLILFYVLSNTASDYFCPAVEHLANSLNLSPAIAGTTLLPLGNGSPDVFSSIAAFTSSGDGGDIGINSVLGGSIFISTVVVGVLSILIAYNRSIVMIDKPNFVRDVVFLLVTLVNLLIIIIIGEISLFVSVFFVSTYICYILVVSYMHFKTKRKLHTTITTVHNKFLDYSISSDGETIPLILPVSFSADEENVVHRVEKDVQCEECEEEEVVVYGKIRCMVKFFCYVMKLPIYLPRRVTIPLVTKERWSKPFLVISMVLAPIMVVLVWNTLGDLGFKGSLVTYFVGCSIGIALGTCTYAFTSSTMPPHKYLVFWYGIGFLMSVIWTYVTCNELVSLLESLGNIIGMNPAIIGLTVLAWGDSIGDLVANVALAMYGGPDGPQIAMSGCYARPLFNVLVGLGFSFVFVSWSKYPASYVIPEDPNLCETIGFLMTGLLWALVILIKRDMRLDHTLGGGLLAIYACFVFIKIARATGLLGDSRSVAMINSL